MQALPPPTSLVPQPLKTTFVGTFIHYLDKKSGVIDLSMQGRSHAFRSGEAQAATIILGPFNLKKWRGPTILLL